MISYLLSPFGGYDLDNKIFQSPYGVLRALLRERGIDLQTYDRGTLSQAAKVLCFNHRPNFFANLKAAGLRRDQLVLFLMEPRPVIPKQYRQRVWDHYGTVFTFLDDLIDNRHIFKMRYPQGQTLRSNIPQFAERKFLTLMNANKYSYVTNELYSVRRRAIRHFEHAADFDLYGYGWGKNGALTPGVAWQALQSGRVLQYIEDAGRGWRVSPSYRGTVENKYATIERYRFCLAFENEKGTRGYISEKIFDCLFSGTVPVYLGAKNIGDEVPGECFIDMRNFASFAELEKFLRRVTATEFNTYQAAGQRFLRDQKFQAWKPAAVFEQIAAHL